MAADSTSYGSPAYERFQARPPGYRRTTAFWVMSAQRPETRAKRLAQLIESLVRGAAIAPLTRTPVRPVKR